MKTCTNCFATVEDKWMDMHERWHAHIDRSFDIAVSGPSHALFSLLSKDSKKSGRKRR
jgi:hypothetical protein